MVELPVAGGVVLCDDADAELIRAAGPWCVKRRGVSLRVERTAFVAKGGERSLGRFLMRPAGNEKVMPRNRFGLDYRRENLVVGTGRALLEFRRVRFERERSELGGVVAPVDGAGVL